MDFDMLSVLVEAARVGSLAGAARTLGISPMVASRRLAALEDDLGVRLMHRTTRSIALTAEGEVFARHAQALLDEARQARASVKPDQAALTGTLRITASHPFGRKILTPLLAAFMDRHRGLKVDLLLHDGLVDIVGQGIDLAIRIAHLKDSGLIARHIVDSPRGLYAAPAYVAACGLPGHVGDLASHQCLLLTGGTHWDLLHAGRARIRAGGRFTATSVEALLQACLAGMGLGMFSHWFVEDEVAQGRLIPVMLADGVVPPLAIHAVYPSTHLVPARVRSFIAALTDRLQHPA